MATRQTIHVLKNTNTPNKVLPSSGVLPGEPLVNYSDGIMYFTGSTTKSKNSFYIKTFSTNINALLNGIIKDANTLGWFPSFMETEKYTGKWDKKYFKEGEIKLRFEAKFDEEVVENIPSILYHITPTQNADKILSIGLVPKSRSKASYHPDRVYLSKDLEDIKNLGEMFYQKTGIKNWTILKIETDMIPGDYLKLYTDPNYKQGYYTLNNIPPQAIEKVKDIEL